MQSLTASTNASVAAGGAATSELAIYTIFPLDVRTSARATQGGA